MSHLLLLATGHVHLQCTLEEEYRSECTERFHWLWIVRYPCLHCCRSIQNVLPSSIGHKGSLSSLIIMGVISQQTFRHRFTVGSRSILDFNIGWIKSPKMQLVLTSLASSYQHFYVLLPKSSTQRCQAQSKCCRLQAREYASTRQVLNNKRAGQRPGGCTSGRGHIHRLRFRTLTEEERKVAGQYQRHATNHFLSLVSLCITKY